MSKQRFFRKKVQAFEHDGETYYARALTGAQLESLMSLDGGESLEGVKAISLVTAFCACDADGNPLFDCKSGEDLEQLRQEGDVGLMKHTSEVAMALSGLGEEDEGNG